MKKKIAYLSFVFFTVFLLSGYFVPNLRAEQENIVKDLIKSLEVGKPVSYKSLTVVPIYLTKVKDRTKYVTLGEALEKKWIEITEVEGGRVPQAKITNRSKNMIYLMGGEILTGCKQDRILAMDLLLAPGTKNLLVPVYCVEQGRWSYDSTSFYSKKNIGTYKIRAKAQSRDPGAQSKIWDQIEKQNRKMGVQSETSAYQDAYGKVENKAKITQIEKRMKDIPQLNKDTVGIVFGLGSKIISVDIFANPFLFEKQWPKILRSSALSSIQGNINGTIGQKDAADFLRSFMNKKFNKKKALDLGNELSVIDSTANINILEYNSSVIHLAGFPQDEERIGVLTGFYSLEKESEIVIIMVSNNNAKI